MRLFSATKCRHRRAFLRALVQLIVCAGKDVGQVAFLPIFAWLLLCAEFTRVRAMPGSATWVFRGRHYLELLDRECLHGNGVFKALRNHG